MFNKKKKHWYNQKPNYKRATGDQPEEKIPDHAAMPETTATQVQEAPQPFIEPESMEQPLSEQPLSEQPSPFPAVGNDSVDEICKICGMPIRNHYTAIRRKTADGMSHFDCVLRELSKENSPKLGKYKRIYYVGSGDFAIVKEFFDKRGHLKSYEILEKINYETKA